MQKPITLVGSKKASDHLEQSTLYQVVMTRQGQVRGCFTDGVYTFKGVPYAEPPFGINRLRPPQPRGPWSGVRDAVNYGPKFPQPMYPPPIASMLPPELGGQGEDCLNLNIWTPELGPARVPVMVWIPGGVYAYHGTGASPWYDGSQFARDGIVCVTINYRVGIDGFVYLDEDNANRGLLDQIAALKWVQENIVAFGGDPNKVTIFGESAGAMSVGTLLAMPRADGLFHRAIAQSGAAHNVISVESARKVSRCLAKKLGVEIDREGLAAIAMDRLLEAQTELETDLATNPDPNLWGAETVLSAMPWQPAVDGKTIPGRAIERIASGSAAGIDVLVGTNTDENRLFLVTIDVIDKITPEMVTGAAASYGLAVEPALNAYRAAHPGASPGELLAAIQTDFAWRIPAIRLADAHAECPAATYMYEFAWRSPQFNGALGACHALEIPFVFDTLGNQTEVLQGTEPPQQLAETMHAAWVAFAKNGDPGWTRYDLKRRATMRFDVKSRLVDDPRCAERELWKDLR